MDSPRGDRVPALQGVNDMRIEDERASESEIIHAGRGIEGFEMSESGRAHIHRQKVAREGREVAAEGVVRAALVEPGLHPYGAINLTQFEKAALNLLGRILVAVEKG